ncbi:HlyIII-domain-containing protein [Microthyrium microscopicum]|uniref:HlyIII-domain-containing protein n=1 Tax=Microthyrium microscopicum TaxID=703497 RepID=A0A6A6TV97_9PEZI|nr:HlyIII-domain-containing protein [Microthyrium microscopicum]
MESYEEPAISTSSRRYPSSAHLRRRRHSSCHSLAWHGESDDLQLLIDRFLVELSRRLDFLESYGALNLDTSIDGAWSTLHAVRDACSRVSDGFLDVGRRKARILVETLEGSYNEALAQKETLEQKVHEGVALMESLLADFEARAYDLKENAMGLSPYDLLDGGRRKVDEGLERAKEVVDAGIDMAWGAAETIEIAVERALDKARQQGLLKVHELPIPWRTNEHIIRGYRFHDTLTGCLRSTVNLSNELFNIWSHAIGLLIVLSIAFYFYPASDHFTIATKTDVFIAGIFFFAACKCLICSTIWHTFNAISEKHLIERFACVDYSGISFLIAASIITTEYTAFYCEPFWRWSWVLTTAGFGLTGIYLTWHPTFNRHDMAWLRLTFYCSLAATGFLPAVQVMYVHGLHWAAVFYAPILKSLAVYFFGAILYTLKIPERWCPGMFDYVGGSHNLWHVAVLGGILFHYMAMQEFFAKAFLRAVSQQCSVY